MVAVVGLLGADCAVGAASTRGPLKPQACSPRPRANMMRGVRIGFTSNKQNEPASYQGKIMTETEFNQLVDATLLKIEAAVDASGADLDYENAAGILTLEFADGGKIIVNRQGPTQEIWVAAKSGGYHYRWDGAAWRNTRDGSELFQSLSAYASQQAGEDIQFH